MIKRNRFLTWLLLGVVALASTSISFSLAWYATSANLRVEAIEINVDTSADLKISPKKDDLDSYTDELTRNDLDKVALFVPVSTMFEDSWHGENGTKVPTFYEYMSFFTPSSGVPYGPSKVKQGFYSQSLYLLADDDVYVSIDPLATSLKANVASNDAYASSIANQYPSLTHEEIVERLNDLEKALRYSIYDVAADTYTIIDPHKEEITYYGGILDNDRDEYYDSYNAIDGFRKETIYGEVYHREKALYSEPLSAETPAPSEYNSFSAKAAKNTCRFLKEESLANGLELAVEQSHRLEEFDTLSLTENPLVMECHRDTPKEIVLSVYLEGWDLDCVNATMGGNFLAQIQFKILREM